MNSRRVPPFEAMKFGEGSAELREAMNFEEGGSFVRTTSPFLASAETL